MDGWTTDACLYYKLTYEPSVIHQHLIIRITKWHNACNTDPSDPIFLSNMHCLMVKVWCKFEQNWTKPINVIEQKPLMLTEFRIHGHAENSIAP